MVAAAKTANVAPTASGVRTAPRHRLERCLLGRERRACSRPVLDRRHRRHGRHALGPGVDAVGAVRLHPGLHLCRDRRVVPEQIGRRLGLWRGGLGALLQVHRAALGLVQLARLDAGARDRLRHRRGLYPQRSVPARGGDQDLGGPAARPRLPQGGPEAPAQLDLLHRRDPDRHLLRHPASRHPLDRQGADHRRRGGAAAAA